MNSAHRAHLEQLRQEPAHRLPRRLDEEILHGHPLQLGERHPREAKRRAIRVEHFEIAVEEQDDVLDLLDEAAHGFEIAHVGQRPGELRELRQSSV